MKKKPYRLITKLESVLPALFKAYLILAIAIVIVAYIKY